MILLFTDFGTDGPYVGQMKAVLQAAAGAVPVVDLMHDAPATRPKPAAYLLAALLPALPRDAVILAVVDPGVGGPRAPLAVRLDGRFLVGPDNGLFAPAASAATETAWFEITWRPASLSASFHGRDLFAPVAARLALGEGIEDLAVATAVPETGSGWPRDLPEVIYIDRFGNAMTGLRAASLQGEPTISLKNIRIPWFRTFSDAAPDAAFWYENSNGLVEIAVNGGSAAKALGLAIGTPVALDG